MPHLLRQSLLNTLLPNASASLFSMQKRKLVPLCLNLSTICVGVVMSTAVAVADACQGMLEAYRCMYYCNVANPQLFYFLSKLSI